MRLGLESSVVTVTLDAEVSVPRLAVLEECKPSGERGKWAEELDRPGTSESEIVEWTLLCMTEIIEKERLCLG